MVAALAAGGHGGGGGGDQLQRHQQGLGRGRVEVTYHLKAFEYYLQPTIPSEIMWMTLMMTMMGSLILKMMMMMVMASRTER